MFCAKTHNMGFVSPADNKTPIVPLQGAALRDCRKRQDGFAIRESCAHPLTHLPAKTENILHVFRFVCGRLVARADRVSNA